MWGAATSAHQVEGGNSLNDWYGWEQKAKVPEKSGAACDHYRRFESDLDLARELHHNAYRFSLEWARIEPRSGEFSEEALSHYEKVIRCCRARGLEPVVTLHHFTNPQWLAEQGGWAWAGSVAAFARYVEKVARRLGQGVRWWITINEPTVLVYYGYLLGTWPPGERSMIRGWRALRNLARAHREAYRILHGEGVRPSTSSGRTGSTGSGRTAAPMVGLAHHIRPIDPCRPGSPLDRAACGLRRHLAYEWLLRCCRGTMDFVGLNYYTRDFLRFGGLLGTVCNADHHPGMGPKSALGWEIYPEGLRRALVDLRRQRLPILITENGVCADDDSVRWRFIEQHLAAMEKAMREGADVRGYLYWSLLDNFEWAEGFKPRFGLIEVEFATQQRRVRESALKLAERIGK